jgi:hypothetical protein
MTETDFHHRWLMRYVHVAVLALLIMFLGLVAAFLNALFQ